MSKWSEWKKNVGEAKPWHLLNQDNYTDEVSSIERFEICKLCPELTPNTHQCKKCGCFMALKVKLETATCPLGKW